MSKETYICAKRPVSLHRELYQCEETYRRPERLDVALGRENYKRDLEKTDVYEKKLLKKNYQKRHM